MSVKGTSKWTHDAIKAIADKHQTRGEFQKRDAAACAAARRSEFGFDYFCSHMTPVNERWNDGKIFAEAKKYKTVREFREGNLAAYTAALRTGRIKEFCAHMTPRMTGLQRYVYQIANAETKLAYVGLSAKPNTRYNEHRRSGKQSVRDLIAGEHVFKIVAGPIDEEESQRLEAETIIALQDGGFHLLNTAKAGALGSLGAIKWTDEAIAEKAKKYNSRKEFQFGNPGAYSAAWRRHGSIDRFCGHMTFSLSSWDSNSIREEALNHSTRVDFEANGGGAVNAARRLGIMDDVCSHMPPKRATKPERLAA